MGKNAYLAKQEKQRQAAAYTFECVTRQLMLDTLQIVLHRECGFGYERIKRVVNAWGPIYDHYYDVMDLKHPECDVRRAHLDAELREIVKDRQPFVDFKGRYPEVKDVKYEGRQSKWTK